MKNQLKTLASVSILALAASGQAGITLNNSAVGSGTTFPTYSISGVNGSLFFQDLLASPSGATLQGGAAQGITANQGFGEVFYYTGPSGLKLSAITIVDNGGAAPPPFSRSCSIWAQPYTTCHRASSTPARTRTC